MLVVIERHCFDPSLAAVDVEKVAVVHVWVQIMGTLLITALGTRAASRKDVTMES